MSKKEKKHDLIYGINPIIELLKAKRRSIATIYTTAEKPKAWDRIERLLPKTVQKQHVTRDILTRLAGTTDHQGVVAYATEFTYQRVCFDPRKYPFVALLDGVQDPRNVGAILRSAYCANVDGVILCKKGGVALTPTALKSSAGLVEHLPIYQAPSAAAAVIELKKAGYSIYLAALGGGDARRVEYKAPLCIVIGSEGAGISSDILNAGTRVMLPQRRPDISYNASVAAGIFFVLLSEKIGKL